MLYTLGDTYKVVEEVLTSFRLIVFSFEDFEHFNLKVNIYEDHLTVFLLCCLPFIRLSRDFPVFICMEIIPICHFRFW